MGLRITSRVTTRHGAAVLAVLLPLALHPASQPVGVVGVPVTERSAGSVAPAAAPLWPARSVTRFDQLDGGSAAPTAVKVSSPKGTRVWTASALADNGLPAAAALAYRRAARTISDTDPGCELPWTLLAAVGRVESDHGRYGGSVLGDDGVSRPLIIGVALDGVGPVAAIPDTDGGRLDGDEVWDRAVGPMQFIPSTWAGAARDGDTDGVRSPNDLDDAALAAAAYLCAGVGSVLGADAMRAAIFRYNPSEEYVALVMAMEAGYRTGAFVLPELQPRAEPEKPRGRTGPERPGTTEGGPSGKGPAPGREPTRAQPQTPQPTSAPPTGDRPAEQGGGQGDGQGDGRGDETEKPPQPKPTGGASQTPTPTPTSTATPKPTQPPPSPKPPQPKPPVLETLGGPLEECGSGWCVTGQSLDLGPDEHLATAAAHDYDGDGDAAETNAAELAGLVGTPVDLLVRADGETVTVYSIRGLDYRLADGTLS